MDYAPLGNSKLEFEKLVMQGKASRVLPSTDTGYKTYGAGRLFLPAGTNYSTNPSFETDSNSDGTADNVVINGSPTPLPTLSRPTGLTGAGYAQRVQHVASGMSGGSLRIDIVQTTDAGTFASGEYATLSFLIKVDIASGCSLLPVLCARDAGGSLLTSFTGSDMAALQGTNRVSISSTALPANTSRLSFHITTNLTTDTGDTLDYTVDNVLIEKSVVLHPYFDGTYDNCAWTGTANASTSTRTISKQQFSTMTVGAEWTVAARIIPLGTDTKSSAYIVFGESGETESGADDAFMGNESGGTHVFRSRPSGSGTQIICDALTIGVNNHVVYRRSRNTADANTNGSNKTQVSESSSYAEGLSTTVNIGSCGAIGSAYDIARAYIGNVILAQTRKSDAWTNAITANSGAAFSDPMRLFRDFMEPGDVIFPLVGDSVGYKKVGNVGGGTPGALDYSFTTTAATTDTGYEVYDG